MYNDYISEYYTKSVFNYKYSWWYVLFLMKFYFLVKKCWKFSIRIQKATVYEINKKDNFIIHLLLKCLTNVVWEIHFDDIKAKYCVNMTTDKSE